MLSRRKILFEKYGSPLVASFSHIHPNLLTIIGSIPSIVFFVCIVMHWYIVALIVFIGNAFDMIDGMVARKFGKVTAFGGLLDSTMDRIADFLIITAFSFGGLVRWEITTPMLLFAFLTSYIRSRGELASKQSVSFAVGLIERPERLLLLYISFLSYVLFPHIHVLGFNLLEIMASLLTILSLVTVWQRIIFAYHAL